jgi:hypothetical protein
VTDLPGGGDEILTIFSGKLKQIVARELAPMFFVISKRIWRTQNFDHHNRLGATYALLYELQGHTHEVGIKQIPAILCCLHVLLESANFLLLLLDGFTISLPLQVEFTFLSDNLRALLRQLPLRLYKLRF